MDWQLRSTVERLRLCRHGYPREYFDKRKENVTQDLQVGIDSEEQPLDPDQPEAAPNFNHENLGFSTIHQNLEKG